jgi:hypothetical protein
MSIVKKCVAWNAARYNQEFNYTLSNSLLQEEIRELLSAKTEVDVLDAIGDIVFVAIGVLWKLGFREEKLENYFYSRDLRTASKEDINKVMNYILDDIIKTLPSDLPSDLGFNSASCAYLACMSVFVICMNKLDILNLQHCFYTIVDAICNSNNTKVVSVTKTSAAIKANIVKGVKYIPPTEDLLNILKHN